MVAHYCFLDDFDGKAFTCHCGLGRNHYAYESQPAPNDQDAPDQSRSLLPVSNDGAAS